MSPDGKTVAFIGGLMSDFGSVGGDVWTVPAAGGTPTDVTPHYKGSFTSLLWDAGGLRATALLGAQAAVVPIDPFKGPGEPLWTAAATIGAGEAKVAFARTGAMATVAQDYEHGPAVFAGPLSAPVRISHDNDGYAPIVAARTLTWKSGGSEVQGWLVAPRVAMTSSAKAPMITVVHGGPAAATTPSFVWQGTTAALVKAGYWLFFPNPRGSYGQGEAFTAANRRDFGGGDLKDILAGIDAVEAIAAPIDDRAARADRRLLWRLHVDVGEHADPSLQGDRRRRPGCPNWISYYGTNGINTWMIPYFGKSAYDDPRCLLGRRRRSAFIKQAQARRR